jgi:protein-disulfide isomerase
VFAFFAGILLGNVTAKPSASDDTAGAEVAAADSDKDVKGVEEKDGPDRFKLPVTSAQPVKGADDALVTIVQFSDFQCPFCSRVEPTIDQLEKDYKGKIRVSWRNNPLPFHQNAMPAAEAAAEAFAQGGNAKFWALHNKMFANQQALTRPDLEKYAQEVGLDMTKFKAALDNHTHQAQIKADQDLGQKMGAGGTPAFFINGRFLSGAQPLPRFKEIIDDELKRADKLLASGVTKKQVYAALTKNGLTGAKAPSADAGDKPKPRQPDPKAVYKVPADKAPQKGPSDALVTIVEFSDYQCPFCSRVEPTIKQITDTYGKDVRVLWRNNPLPFHDKAALAAEAAMEAGDQGKFWEYHDKLFGNQQALAREDLEKYAKELGLNAGKFKAALDNNEHKSQIDADQQLARSLGASGTPSFFINGRSLRGAQPFDAFKAVIDEELQKAKDLVAKGTPRAQVYAKTIENGATAQKFIEGDAPSAKAAEPDADKVYAIPAVNDAPVKGAKKAKVVIQEFSDFQCPFCSRVLPTIKQVEADYGDKVQIVWRNFPLPFHDKAQKAAEAAREVFEQGGSEKFWAYHDELFGNQQALTPEDLVKYAEKIGGINTGKLKAALDSDKHKSRVQADIDAVNKAGARIGTPSFFINGKLLQGAQPYPAFKQAIDKALAEAK